MPGDWMRARGMSEEADVENVGEEGVDKPWESKKPWEREAGGGCLIAELRHTSIDRTHPASNHCGGLGFAPTCLPDPVAPEDVRALVGIKLHVASAQSSSHQQPGRRNVQTQAFAEAHGGPNF